MPVYAITGVSGYLGQRILKHLEEVKSCTKVIGFDVKDPRFRGSKLKFFKMDVRDPKLGDIIKEEQVAVAVHLAFIVDPLYDEKEMHDIDVMGTENVLSAVARSGTVKQLLVTSSASAYGARPDNPEPLVETDPLRGNEDFVYGHDKKIIDLRCQKFAAEHPDIVVSILRPAIVLGPNVKNYIATALLKFPVITLLDGWNTNAQFVHEDDVVKMTTLLLLKKKAGAFNCGGRGVVSMADLAKMMGKRTLYFPKILLRGIMWVVWKLRLTPFAFPPGLVSYLQYPWVLSMEKAKAELGFEPLYTSEECFRIAMEHQEEIIEGFKDEMERRGKK